MRGICYHWHVNTFGLCLSGELRLYSGSTILSICATDQPWVVIGASHSPCYKVWVFGARPPWWDKRSLWNRKASSDLTWGERSVRKSPCKGITLKDLKEDLRFVCQWNLDVFPGRRDWETCCLLTKSERNAEHGGSAEAFCWSPFSEVEWVAQLARRVHRR